jgi:hypothetical protein
MRALLICILIVVAAAVTSVDASAQYVRGGVFQSDTGQPVAGAMVLLIDESGETRVSVLTNEAGRYVMNARVPGRYALKVQRIGFQDVFTPHFDVEMGRTVERDVQAAPQAIVLQGITAEARRRCVTRPAEGLAVATLWEEARKALAAAAYTEQEAMYRYRVRHTRRELDASTLRVLHEQVRAQVGVADGSPFVSLPAERLLRDGFVSLSDTASFYYAPDAHVLLSDGFLDAYCFRIAEQAGQSQELIGLAFEPADRRGPPAVRGTLWIDRTTFELRHLEYGYARVSFPDGPAHRIGGKVEFEALPNGTWIVRRWWIRMPHVENRSTPWRAAGSRVTPTIVALVEEGGDVAEVMSAQGGASISAASYASVRGTVFDSASALPLAGATVRLTGTDHSAETDEQGRYEIAGLAEGEYTIEFEHPRLGLYGWVPQPLAVPVARGAMVDADLAVPLAVRGRGITAQCTGDAALTAALSAVLRGRVVDDLTGTAIPGAAVTVEWEREQDGVAQRQVRTVRADAEGRFVACALPATGTLRARVAMAGRVTDHEVEAPGAAGLLVRDLALRTTLPQPVVVIVQDHESGRPIQDAIVVLPGLDLRGVTNRQGRLTFDAVPPGRHDFRIEHIAYGSHLRDLTVGTEPETFEVRVPTQAIALSGIEVTVRPVVEEARRTRGTRINVMDRTEIAKLERTSEHVGHLAQRIPGLRMQETFTKVGGLRDGICVTGSRGVTASGAEPCMVIILDNIPLGDTSILLSLAPDAIESIEFLNPVEAGPRYGTVAGQAGALLVWTRGNGPYAQQRSR